MVTITPIPRTFKPSSQEQGAEIKRNPRGIGFAVAIALGAMVVSTSTVAAQSDGRGSSHSGPRRIAIILDRTLSMVDILVAEVTTKMLRPLLETVAESGGDVRVYFVRDNGSRTPVFEVAFRSPAPPPVRPPKTGELFRDADHEASHRSAYRSWESKEAARRVESRQKVGAFLAEVEGELGRKELSSATDLAGTIHRASGFLSEPVPPGASEPTLLVVAFSDGEENAGRRPMPALPSRTTIVIYSPTGKPGSLSALGTGPPLVFSSPLSAIEYASALIRRMR